MSGIMEDAYKAVRDLTITLENHRNIHNIEDKDPSQNVVLCNLLTDIDRVNPFCPKGLFSVDR